MTKEKKLAWKNGVEQSKKEIAKKLLKEKFSIDTISKVTGLSREELEKLK